MQHTPTDREAGEAAAASDLEQRLGRAGNSRTPREADEPRQPPAEQVLGGSGHVVRHEIAEALVGTGSSGSPGADADRRAARR